MLFDKDFTNILVVEAASTVRQMLSDLLKDMGYKHITAVSKLKDAVHFIEVEKVDWLITSSFSTDEVNIINLLELIVHEPVLRQIRVSLLLEPEKELHILSLAFELGLLSWHRKAYIKDDLIAEFEDLFSLHSIKKKNDVLTSAEYLRKYLTEEKAMRNLLVFEQNLIAYTPGSAHCLLSLAEAQYLNNRLDDCRATLNQVEVINSKLAPLVERARKKYNLETEVKGGSGSSQNCLGIKHAVVIDSDTDNLHHVQELLEKIGVKKIDFYEDGVTAFAQLTNQPEPGVILMEWRVPGVLGPVLIQNIRNHGFVSVPIIVISSLIQNEDIPIVKEMSVDNVLKKPFENDDFFKTLVWTIQQNNTPSEQRSFELKIIRLLERDKINEAERLLQQFINDDRIKLSNKLAIHARFLYSKGELKRVEQMSLAVLKKDPQNLLILNLLGKTYLKWGDYGKALICFEKAQKISPMNIKRLVDIADTNLSLGNETASQEALEKAKKIDSNNEIIQQSECRHALERGDTDTAAQIFRSVDNLMQIVRDMNNRAVALARGGRYEDSIGLYKKTLSTLPHDEKELVLIVGYNLALAYARYGDLEGSCNTLRSLNVKEDFPVGRKIYSLLKKTERALESGTSLQLRDEEKTEEPQMEELDPIGNITESKGLGNIDDYAKEINELFTTLSAERGDICCHLIYFDVEGVKMADDFPTTVAFLFLASGGT